MKIKRRYDITRNPFTSRIDLIHFCPFQRINSETSEVELWIDPIKWTNWTINQTISNSVFAMQMFKRDTIITSLFEHMKVKSAFKSLQNVSNRSVSNIPFPPFRINAPNSAHACNIHNMTHCRLICNAIPKAIYGITRKCWLWSKLQPN